MQPIKCEMCGGNLIVDVKSEFITCDFCGMKYSKESIKNKVQTVKGTVEITTGNAEIERQLKDAEALINFREIDKAKAKLIKITDSFPSDYRAWYKLAMLEIESFFSVTDLEETDIIEIRKNNPDMSLNDVADMVRNRLNKQLTIQPSVIPVSDYEKKCCIIKPECKVDFEIIRDKYSKEHKALAEQLKNSIVENSKNGLPVFNIMGLVGNEYRHVRKGTMMGSYDKVGRFVYNKQPDEPLFTQVNINSFYDTFFQNADTFKSLISHNNYKLVNLLDIADDIQIPAFVPCNDGWYRANDLKYKQEDSDLYVKDKCVYRDEGYDDYQVGVPQIMSIYMLGKIEAILKCKLKTHREEYTNHFIYIKFNKPYEVDELFKYVMKFTPNETLNERLRTGLCPTCGGAVNKYSICTQCDKIQNYNVLCSSLFSTCRRFKDRAILLGQIKSFSYEKIYKGGLVFTNKISIDYIKPDYKDIVFTVNATGWSEHYTIREYNIVDFVRFVERKEKLQSSGVCQYCGGQFKGLIIKKCSKCGMKKDY